MRTRLWPFALVFLLALALATAPAAAQRSAVRFGLTPFVDYGPWIIAHELGYFEDEGLDVRFINLASDNEIAEAIAGGGIDVGTQSPDSALYFYPQNPDLRIVHIGTLFEGFAITGRPGMETYNDLVAQGYAPADAAYRVARQMEGKVILTEMGSIHEHIVEAALDIGGLTQRDARVVDIPTPVEGAAAFIQGEGDFFSAGLPQTIRLRREGYPIVLPGEALGPGGLNLSGLQASREFAEKNPTAVLKLIRAWYRAVSYLHQNDTEALALMVDWLNRNTGAGLTVDEARRLVTEDLKFAGSPIESYYWFYDPESRAHWKTHMEYRLNSLIEKGDVPAGAVDLDAMIIAPRFEVMALESMSGELTFE